VYKKIDIFLTYHGFLQKRTKNKLDAGSTVVTKGKGGLSWWAVSFSSGTTF